MRKIIFIGLMIFMSLSSYPAIAEDIHVYDCRSIQQAISEASDGDFIHVHPGVYNENVIVDRSVTLQGMGSDETVVWALHPSRPCFLVRANDVNLNGFGISGALDRSVGVHLSSSHNTTIANNTFINNYANVYIEYTNNSSIQDNVVALADWKGIAVYNHCNNTIISRNIISHIDGSGIFMKNCVNNTTIMDNTVEHIDGMGAIYSNVHCHYSTITRNVVKNNVCDYGTIFVSGGNNNTITDNIVTGNRMKFYGGITLYSTSEGNIVTRNILTNNTPDDLHVRFAQNCLIYDNYIDKTAYIGFTLYDTSKPNRWNVTPTPGKNIIGGPIIGGNFWRNYTSPDSNHDGIGNMPFALPRIPNATDYDYHPLVHISGEMECGDVDCNGAISANDVVDVYRKAADQEYIICSVWAADADGNGYISANDVTEVYRKAINPAHPLHCDTN